MAKRSSQPDIMPVDEDQDQSWMLSGSVNRPADADPAMPPQPKRRRVSHDPEGRNNRRAQASRVEPTSEGQNISPPLNDDDSTWASVTTRKSKACPGCRKQKIKCIMENDMPPCKRCVERGLCCMQSRTLQSLVEDQGSWNTRIERQIAALQAALNEARGVLTLAPLNDVELDQLPAEEDPPGKEQNIDDEDSEIDDDMALATPESLGSAPIRSLYEVTKLHRRAQQSADAKSEHELSGLVLEPDFIARDVIKLEDAEQLAQAYLNRLDHYFYGHLGRYSGLADVRKSSTLLAVCICTVAALHDPQGSDLYERCGREFRGLLSTVMFSPRLGLEDIRALCIGSYWLGDMTWMLSGVGIRKAITLRLHKAHLKQPEGDRDDFLRSQLWLLLYLCDEQISTLHGMPPSMIDKDSIKWERHMTSPFASDPDVRCVSHVDLLLILSRVRELFGSDTTKPIPPLLVSQLRNFDVQVDRWGATWSGKLGRNECLGDFPSHAVKLHYHFAKFYLCSHAFRGLRTDKEAGATLSHDLEDIAACATSTAFTILHSLLDSEDLRAGLVGVPHYFHTMYTFASVFLLKVATKYSQHVTVDADAVFETTSRVAELFNATPCARQHLVHRIAKGLREMIASCKRGVVVGSTADEAANFWEDGFRGAYVDTDPGSTHPGEGLLDATPQPLNLRYFDFLDAFSPA